MDNILELTANLVAAQASGRRMEPHAITNSLETIHATLSALADAESVATHTERFAKPTDSIERSHITCLECGKPFKLLSNRHLAQHNLTPTAYKAKHGLRKGQSLSARELTARRRKIAINRQAGGQLAAWRAARKQSA